MKKRTRIGLYLILLFLVLLCSAKVKAYGIYDVNMVSKGSGKYYYDGRKKEYDGGYTVYHRFTVNKPALMHMYGDSYYFEDLHWEADMHADFSIYDQYKRFLFKISDYYEEDEYEGDPYSYFFLKPGTYYLRLDGDDMYTLNLEYEYYNRKVSTKKNKARNVKAKKDIEGYFLRGESKTHWYRIKLKKKQYIHFDWEAYGTGRIYCYIYGKGIKKNSAYAWCYDSDYYDEYGKTKGGSLSPGIYYLKVIRKSSKISGGYSLRWH